MNYTISKYVSIVLPSKVRAQITPIHPSIKGVGMHTWGGDGMFKNSDILANASTNDPKIRRVALSYSSEWSMCSFDRNKVTVPDSSKPTAITYF